MKDFEEWKEYVDFLAELKQVHEEFLAEYKEKIEYLKREGREFEAMFLRVVYDEVYGNYEKVNEEYLTYLN